MRCIQTKIHPKVTTTNSISRNGSVSTDNFQQFTEESIRTGPLNKKNLGLECDISEVWNLCKEEESQGRLNIPDSLHREMCATGHTLTRTHAEPLYNAILQSLEVLWADFLKSECYCKYQVEILTSDHVTLADILFHPTGMSYFMEFKGD
ncbi:uncharacterized protein LOC103517367 [Diaphorina citri]|uniref:Uncharacterized protein LOC103517367 n=1 Tax=Diaphorina citri TaxID=121845 RepID=A0A1S3DFJ8_DIACI|nr:uncharacterized protein LOC103517367 [Diaphorina citri]